MAVAGDYEACEQQFLRWSAHPVKKVIGLSLDERQRRIVQKLYPFAQLLDFRVKDWDLNEPGKEAADLVVACNVFHYSPDPLKWFTHVLACCKQFWIQDLLFRHRGKDGLGPDGDRTRYSYGPDGRSNTFDLSVLGDRLLDFEAYDAGSMDCKRLTLNFVARIRGDWA